MIAQNNKRNSFSVTIQQRLLGGFILVTLLVIVVAVIAVSQQTQIATRAAITETEHLATLVSDNLVFDRGDGTSTLFADHNALEAYVQELHNSQQRDIAIVDTNKVIMADKDTDQIGTTVDFDPDNEVGQTLRD